MVKAVHITADQVTLGKTRTRGHMEPSQAWSDLVPSVRKQPSVQESVTGTADSSHKLCYDFFLSHRVCKP